MVDILKPLVEEYERRDARLVRALAALFGVDEADLRHAVSMHLSQHGLSVRLRGQDQHRINHVFPWPDGVTTPADVGEVLEARSVLPTNWSADPRRVWVCQCQDFLLNATDTCGACGGGGYLTAPPTMLHLLGLLARDWATLETLVREAIALHFPGGSAPTLAWGASAWSANVAYRASRPLVESEASPAARQAAHARLTEVRAAGVMCSRLTVAGADLYFPPDQRLHYASR